MTRSQLLTIIGILLAMFLGALDQTIVATALPKIVEDLQGLDRFSWVATSYLVASTAFVPIYGKLADLYTHKKIEIVAVVIFLIGSMLCGMAGEFGTLPLLGDGMTQLILFRAIQGIGGAGLFAMAFIIIAGMFPPSERGKYQGWVGAVFAIASVLGPWLGGILTDQASDIIPGIAGWRWVFYVNLPFGALALWFIINKMPAYKHEDVENTKLDYLAAFLLIIGLAPIVIALQLEKSIYPWTSPLIVGLIFLSLLSISIFYFRSKRSTNPILNLNLFKNSAFRTANPPTFLMGASFMGILIFLPLFLINVQGANATQAGLGMIPLSAGILIASILSGQLVSRMGNYKILLLIGVSIFFIGVFLLSTLNVNTSYNQILLYMFISGIGMGPAMPLYPLAIQNAVDQKVLGQATSANQFFRQIGGAIGASVLGAILATSLSNSFHQLHNENQTDLITANDLMQEGSVAANRSFQKSDSIVIWHLNEWYIHKDLKSRDILLSKNNVPNEVKKDIRDNQPTQINFEKSKNAFQKVSDADLIKLQEAIKGSFAKAIRKIYQYLLYVVALAWLFTWFIPQLPLRKK